MIDRESLDVFGYIVSKYANLIQEDYKGRLVCYTFASGAKLEINDETFKLTTKDGIFTECEYTHRLCVALEVQDENVFITLYNLLDDYIYENVFNCMIYERYP